MLQHDCVRGFSKSTPPSMINQNSVIIPFASKSIIEYGPCIFITLTPERTGCIYHDLCAQQTVSQQQVMSCLTREVMLQDEVIVHFLSFSLSFCSHSDQKRLLIHPCFFKRIVIFAELHNRTEISRDARARNIRVWLMDLQLIHPLIKT